jgi:arsenate reductase (thioredoxin)
MNILFLCTHNSARSILSEALLNHLSHTIGNGKFKAYSAGSSPRENQQPNPLAIQALKDAGIETNYLSSKSWDVFAEPDAPKMDLVVTVCDNAAAEVCPFFPSSGTGKPAKAHWGYADPSLVQDALDVRLQAFVDTMNLIETRLKAFIANGEI